MSTLIALFLVLSTLAGCAGEAISTARSAPPPPAVCEVAVKEGTLRDGDGTELVSYSYDIPVLRRGGEEVAAFSEPFAALLRDAEGAADAAREDRALRAGTELEFFPYIDELRCEVYQTERLVSVAGTYYSFTGGAHGNTVLLSWNFDLETGEFFNPALLDEETGFHRAVTAELVRQARARAEENGMAPEDFFWEDYPDTLDNWNNYAVSFDGGGMTVGFSPYELASYAAGAQVFEIPYEDLKDCLGPRGRELLGLEG